MKQTSLPCDVVIVNYNGDKLLSACIALILSQGVQNMIDLEKFIRDVLGEVAEQVIRFIVIDRHVTQGTRSIKGRKSCERVWSVIATCALQGCHNAPESERPLGTVIATCALQDRSAFNFILKAVKAYFQDQPSPSLLPDPL